MNETLEKLVDLYKKNIIEKPDIELQPIIANTCECYTCNCDCHKECDSCYDY